MAFLPDSLSDLMGKVYIVTGGKTGMSMHNISYITPID